ncbi:MAG: hypothetical protein GY896_22885 [Gammaproteobacteria bacterium]|nr:hypothetical protein [Gammaproteobacteria bacterium]
MKKFEDIATEVSQKASRVDCHIDDYIEGLKLIIERLQEDINAARETTR